MKNLIILAAFITGIAQAQDVGVKVDNVNASQDTTISIKKGDSGAKKKYTISEGTDEIAGDKDVLKKNAELNWKKACDEWKKELRENNKDSKVLSVTCGSMTCTKEGVESTCRSQGSYKIRVLMEE